MSQKNYIHHVRGTRLLLYPVKFWDVGAAVHPTVVVGVGLVEGAHIAGDWLAEVGLGHPY